MIGQWARLFTQLKIEWIGGVGYNTSVPSDPLMDVCMAQLPAGETNPLSARSRSSQTKRTVRIGVGLLPYISIASVWRRRRPVLMNLAASRHWLCFDTSSCRILPLADLANAWRMLFPEAVTCSVRPGRMSAEPCWWPWSRTVANNVGDSVALNLAFDTFAEYPYSLPGTWLKLIA